MLDFLGVFFFGVLERGMGDFFTCIRLLSGRSEKGGRLVADNDLRSDDCNGERRIPSSSLFGMVGKAVCRNDGMKAACSSSVSTFSSPKDG